MYFLRFPTEHRGKRRHGLIEAREDENGAEIWHGDQKRFESAEAKTFVALQG